MARHHTKKSEKHIGSSIVTRLNTRLFFRLLGIFFSMDLLLSALCFGGLVFWAERQCGDIAALVDQRGIPSAEATEWMAAGDYTVTALDRAPQGWRHIISFFSNESALPNARRTLDLHAATTHRGGQVTRAVYTVELYNNDGQPYAIALDVQGAAHIMAIALQVLVICQVISLILNLMKNAGTIRRTLRPIQELAAAAAKLSHVSATMPPEELRALAGKLDQINATHLDARISVPGAQKELQALAAAINAMLDRVEEAYRSQARFVSDASHELRTPIAVIQGYASLLNRWGKDDPATRQEAIDAIQAEADSMKELVEQLLFLARGDNDSAKFDPEFFDLTEVGAEVLRETAMICQQHPLRSDWPGPVPIFADMGLIKQCLRILVDNAIKYSPDGAPIAMSAQLRQGYAAVSVEDRGMGVAPEALPHIFDRFYRADQSRTRATGGTGLGLSIALWIAQRHGGWFEVTSFTGVGTRFTLFLPLSEPRI